MQTLADTLYNHHTAQRIHRPQTQHRTQDLPLRPYRKQTLSPFTMCVHSALLSLMFTTHTPPNDIVLAISLRILGAVLAIRAGERHQVGEEAAGRAV